MAEIAKKLWLNSLTQYLLLQAESKEENATQKVPLKHFGVTSKGQKTRENYHFFPNTYILNRITFLVFFTKNNNFISRKFSNQSFSYM